MKPAASVLRLSDALRKASAAPQGEIQEMPCDLIDTEEQVRPESDFDPEGLEELAGEMKSDRRDTIPPILVRLGRKPGRYLLVYGERRLRSARLADLPTIRTEIRDLTDDQAEDIQFAENIHRKDLSLMAEARQIRKRYDKHKKAGVKAIVDTIAAEINKKKPWVSKRLALSEPNLPHEISCLIEDGITEDLELLNTTRKLLDISRLAGCELIRNIRKGAADRAEARRRLAAEKERLAAEARKIEEEEAAEADAEAAGKPKGKGKGKATAPSMRSFQAICLQLYRVVFEHAEDDEPIRELAGRMLDGLTDIERAGLDQGLRAFYERGPAVAAGGPTALIRLVAGMLNENMAMRDAKALLFGDYFEQTFTLGAFLMGAAGLPFSLEALIDAVAPADLATQGEQ